MHRRYTLTYHAPGFCHLTGVDCTALFTSVISCTAEFRPAAVAAVLLCCWTAMLLCCWTAILPCCCFLFASFQLKSSCLARSNMVWLVSVTFCHNLKLRLFHKLQRTVQTTQFERMTVLAATQRWFQPLCYFLALPNSPCLQRNNPAIVSLLTDNQTSHDLCLHNFLHT